MNLHLILLVLSLFCFVLATVPTAAPYWNRLVSLGLALLVGSML